MKITRISKLIFVLALSMFLAKTVWCQTVSNNYWGGPDPTGSTPPPDWPNFNYSATSVLGVESGITGISCGSSEITKHGRSQPLGIENQPTTDSCLVLDNIVLWDINFGQYDAGFDTGMYFVKHCPGFPRAFNDFGGTFAASQVQTPEGKLALREFLLNMLPAATAGGNFCDCVGCLAATFGSDADLQLHDKADLSIMKFLMTVQACQNYDSEFTRYSQLIRRNQILSWMDTAKNDSLKYFDSTLFTMHDLGLDSVLKYAAMLGVHAPGMESILSNASVSPNPAGTGTELYFTTSKEAYVKVDLYNTLGVRVGGGFESVLQPGNHEVPLSLAGLPSGTYYARIVTTYGEVQTVKLVKQ